jgi:hypothetical protein
MWPSGQFYRTSRTLRPGPLKRPSRSHQKQFAPICPGWDPPSKRSGGFPTP